MIDVNDVGMIDSLEFKDLLMEMGKKYEEKPA